MSTALPPEQRNRATKDNLMVTVNEDSNWLRETLTTVQTTLANIKGQLDSTLPHHAAKIDNLDVRVTEHDRLLREIALKQAEATGADKQRNTIPPIATYISVVAAVILAVVTTWSLTRGH